MSHTKLSASHTQQVHGGGGGGRRMGAHLNSITVSHLPPPPSRPMVLASGARYVSMITGMCQAYVRTSFDLISDGLL